jgi:FkbM family methyltransferase
MPAFFSLLKVPIQILLGKVPRNFLERIEDLIQKQLGKGSGAWSTKEEAQVIATFSKSLGIEEVVAIDAGANNGNWTAELLQHLPLCSIIAFEPSKIAFSNLSSRFADDKRVTMVNIALGNVSKRSSLYADEGGSGLGSLTKRRVLHFDLDFNHREEVEIQTLDDWYLRNANFPIPNVLKMDVEGHELDILHGAAETLKNIKIIQFEFGGSNIDTRTFFQDFWYFFQELGFEIYRLGPARSFLIRAYSERDESFRATNYVAVRKSV